jgi:hypothetical protein
MRSGLRLLAVLVVAWSSAVAWAQPCPTAPTGLTPADGAEDVLLAGTLNWSAVPNADSYQVFLGPRGSGCQIPYGQPTTANSLSYSGLQSNAAYEWRVLAIHAGCQLGPSISACASFTTVPPCLNRRTHLVYPVDDSTSVSSPVLFAWTPVRYAVGYDLYLSMNGSTPALVGSTTDKQYIVLPLPVGSYDWYIVTLYAGCPSIPSDNSQFTVVSPPCTAPAKTRAAVVRTVTTGEQYTVRWRPVPGSSTYLLQESTALDFSTTTFSVPVQAASQLFQHDAGTPTPYFYRVQPIGDCLLGGTHPTGAFSTTVRTIVIPKPPQTHKKPQLVTESGAHKGITHTIFIPGSGSMSQTFAVTSDKPWISINPSTGPLPPGGATVAVTVDPTTLDSGNHTASLSFAITGTASKLGNPMAAGATPAIVVPVSISLVTPVTPQTRPGPGASTIIIPAVSHASGVDSSQWQSDIRLANPSNQPQAYDVTFIPSGTDVTTTDVHSTTVEIDPGDTTAIDDIVNNWYGYGALDNGLNGALQITPIDSKGNPLNVVPRLVAIASSRTYDVTSNGSLGQYVSAIPFTSFVAQSLDLTKPAKLSLQQIAQSADFRTNVGFVEAAGQPATLSVNVFGSLGNLIKGGIPISLAAGQQLQMNQFLALQNINNLTDGRMEVSVVSPTGKVTAYASVVDMHTNDPLVVNGVQPTAVSSNRYTIPGVADLNTASLHWRSDVRLFNPGSSLVNATATFYPSTPSNMPLVGQSNTISINPGEVKILDNLLQGTFGVTNAGGSLQITTTTAVPLVVTALTYNRDPATNGTYGQFVPGVTAADAVGNGDVPLQLLQLEESAAFRSNVGIAEVTGNPATVQIFAIVPDAKATPSVLQTLRPNEFVQLNSILKSFGFSSAYNARIAIQTIGGTGKVTAYASVVDNTSSDPTYVPAQ